MIVIDRKAAWVLELAWLVASLAELGHERAIITREYLHSMIVAISDEQETSMMVEHQAKREGEQAIIVAMSLGANRELDSSIRNITKRRIAHLPEFSQSHNTKKKDGTRRETREQGSDAPARRRRRNKEQHQALALSSSISGLIMWWRLYGRYALTL